MPGLWRLGCLGSTIVGGRGATLGPNRVSRPFPFCPKERKSEGRVVAAMGVISSVISADGQYSENRLIVMGDLRDVQLGHGRLTPPH